MRIVYVTAGTVGVGDLMHGVALRAAQRTGLRITVSLVSSPSPFPAVARLAVELDPAALVEPARAASTPLAQALLALRADVVVVGRRLWHAPCCGAARTVCCDGFLFRALARNVDVGLNRV